MCGIIGYVGNSNTKEILLDILSSLEYRGYDSSGIGLINNNQIQLFKAIGKLDKLKSSLDNINIKSTIGLGHTRWATHGKPSLENAHPHISNNKKIILVHNGIIDNYLELKDELEKENISFYGKTDSEVIVKYIEYHYQDNPYDILFELTNKLKGSYALGIIFLEYPNQIFFIKNSSPLLIGIGEDEVFLSSDYSSLENYTNRIIFLDDLEYGSISKDKCVIYKNKKEKRKEIKELTKFALLEESIHTTFLEKEIHETSTSVRNILSRYIKDNNIDFSSHSFVSKISQINKINIYGCGSSYNVGLIGKYLFEKLASIPTEVKLASEYIYYPKLKNTDSLNIFISQSGETADLLNCVHLIDEFKLGILNVKYSSLSFKMDDNLFLECGKEVSVATTKAYIGQLTFLYLLSFYIGYQNKSIPLEEYQKYILELNNIPSKINHVLNNHQNVITFSNILKDYNNVFFIGRGQSYLSCIEGSLKLKEVTYIHSEAIASGELKHGTISLIDENVYVIALTSSLREKTLSNIEEIKARNGKVFTISNSNSSYIIPSTLEIFYPFLEIIPLQLIALYTGLNKKLDIDKPRNLAKSVTVE